MGLTWRQADSECVRQEWAVSGKQLAEGSCQLSVAISRQRDHQFEIADHKAQKADPYGLPLLIAVVGLPQKLSARFSFW